MLDASRAPTIRELIQRIHDRHKCEWPPGYQCGTPEAVTGEGTCWSCLTREDAVAALDLLNNAPRSFLQSEGFIRRHVPDGPWPDAPLSGLGGDPHTGEA